MGYLISRAVNRRQYNPVRGKELIAFADEFGFKFSSQADLSAYKLFSEFEFYEGNPHKFENFITGNYNGSQFRIFDVVYRNHQENYDFGTGTTTSRQTMFVIKSDKLNLPRFYLRPENFGLKLLGSLTQMDIDFAERPDFSKKFLLYGENERAIRQLFSAKLFEYFEKNPNTYLFGNKQHLFVYYSRNLIAPTQMSQWLKYAENLQELFQNRTQ